MTDARDFVVGTIALNGGQLVSKIRLQKTFYLLEQCGLDSNFQFEYRHYGPFSIDLARAADDAVAAERLSQGVQQGYHSEPYTIYSTKEAPPHQLGSMSEGDLKEKLEVLDGYSSLELEVAATIIYLQNEGNDEAEAIEGAKTLKPRKATKKRIERALKLFREAELRR